MMDKKELKEMLALARKRLTNAHKIYVKIYEALWVQMPKKEIPYILKYIKGSRGETVIKVGMEDSDAYIDIVQERDYPDRFWEDDD